VHKGLICCDGREQVCELDIIFNFHKVRGANCNALCAVVLLGGGSPCSLLVCVQAYYILDELLLAGYLQEANKREVLHVTAIQDELMDETKDGERKPRR